MRCINQLHSWGKEKDFEKGIGNEKSRIVKKKVEEKKASMCPLLKSIWNKVKENRCVISFWGKAREQPEEIKKKIICNYSERLAKIFKQLEVCSSSSEQGYLKPIYSQTFSSKLISLNWSNQWWLYLLLTIYLLILLSFHSNNLPFYFICQTFNNSQLYSQLGPISINI